MNKVITNFLHKETMGVLAVILPDGTPHTAAMHFVYQDGVIYFSTHKTTRKLTGLASGSAKASVTVGFSETEWKTVQLDGVIVQIADAKNIMIGKYPDQAKRIDENTVFLKFTPTWYCYTDYKSQPATIIENQ